ncbi:EAL domain-containing protein [Paracoccaceae bacterium Fryx2]|nr:EAL domain-containing protein [Paracoccaceae bacterium Fryx2]
MQKPDGAAEPALADRARLAALADLQVMHSPRTAALDAIVASVAAIFGCPVALVSLIGHDEQWFKARHGTDLEGTSRDVAFCNHTIRMRDPLVVPDSRADTRFADNPLVTGAPHIRFYAGVPVSVDGTTNLGALCVMDTRPRSPTPAQMAHLQNLARAVEGLLQAESAARAARIALRDAEAQRQMAERRELLLRQVERMAEVSAWRVSFDGSPVEWSDGLYRLHDLAPDTPLTLDLVLSYYPEPDRSRVRAAIDPANPDPRPFDLEADFRTPSGPPRRIRTMGEVEYVNGRPGGYFGIFQDITERVLAERKLWHTAHVDDLCDIPNRRWFHEHLAAAIATRREGPDRLALMLIDLDHFKEVNDSLGHRAGDVVIRSLAQRLLARAGPDTFVARLAGDEFALLLHTPLTDADLQTRADAVLADLRAPVAFGGRQIFPSASLGIACFPTDAETADDLLGHADMALYRVKRTGRSSAGFYSADLGDIFDTRRLAVENVRRASIEGRIVPHYQPKVRLSDGRLTGFEALARIVTPAGEVCESDAFHPALSDPASAQLIHRHMIEALTTDIRRWLDRGLIPGTISFNAFEFCFHTPRFVDHLIARLDALRIPRAMIEVEVTETVFWGDDPALSGRILHQLRDSGLRISLDDFGCGTASLLHLREFPIDCIKIDKSFIAGMQSNDRNLKIVKSVLALGHDLQMEIVAEGIETKAQSDLMRDMGCDTGQGYLFGTALPAAEAELRMDRKPGPDFS